MNRIGVIANHVAAAKSGRLEGKNAVVTGAGSGIGRASAILFAKEGANVVCSDINEDGINSTVAEIQRLGGKAVARVCDVGDADQVESLIELCCSTFGSIDICFANAGVAILGPYWIETPEIFETTFRVNVIGVFNCFKAAAQKMDARGKGGSLLATASVAGLRSGAGSASYSASKAAVINLCQVFANQLTGTDIRCNCICPGLIETGMTEVLFDAAKKKGTTNKIGQLNPTLRYGFSEEIAAAALFLASSESSYVNGQALPVCGGLSSSLPVSKRGKGMSF